MASVIRRRAISIGLSGRSSRSRWEIANPAQRRLSYRNTPLKLPRREYPRGAFLVPARPSETYFCFPIAGSATFLAA
jgi:hypothetical protein